VLNEITQNMSKDLKKNSNLVERKLETLGEKSP